MMECKNCGAKISQEDLDYVQEHEIFPSELEHQVDCGCEKYDEGLDMIVCYCDFIQDKKQPVDYLENKFVLDVTCGGRMMWFNKNNPAALYIDNRKEEKGFHKPRPNFEVNPDIVMDFTDLKFPDKSFKLIVFDPPHMFRTGKLSWLNQKYGTLNKETWKSDIKKGFEECYRVLDDYGTLIFKWSEDQIKVKEVLRLFPIQPLFGHPTGKNGKTMWMCFIKIPLGPRNALDLRNSDEIRK